MSYSNPVSPLVRTRENPDRTTMKKQTSHIHREVALYLANMDERLSDSDTPLSTVTGKRSLSSFMPFFGGLTISAKRPRYSRENPRDCEICGRLEHATRNVICNACQMLEKEGATFGEVPKWCIKVDKTPVEATTPMEEE